MTLIYSKSDGFEITNERYLILNSNIDCVIRTSFTIEDYYFANMVETLKKMNITTPPIKYASEIILPFNLEDDLNYLRTTITRIFYIFRDVSANLKEMKFYPGTSPTSFYLFVEFDNPFFLQ
jgi:hypothetical protein